VDGPGYWDVGGGSGGDVVLLSLLRSKETGNDDGTSWPCSLRLIRNIAIVNSRRSILPSALTSANVLSTKRVKVKKVCVKKSSVVTSALSQLCRVDAHLCFKALRWQ